MNKINSLIAILFSAIPLWASNTITYTATEKLQGENGRLDIGATTFGPPIVDHIFLGGAGAIICDGEVTMIGDWAFYGCSGLTSIEIPNSVKTIGRQAFYDCSGLPSISIPDSVKTIGDHAFDGCSGLTSIEIPNPVSTIGEYVFRYCDNLTSVTLPNSLVTIGDDAFCFCSRLISITIPYSVTTIGSCIFSHCYSLNSINVDAANTHYSAVDGVLFNYTKDTLIQYPTGNIQAEYEIPNSVTTIGEWAFGNCMHLALVTIPLSVTTIEDCAFAGCSGLYKITIPSSVTTIGERALSCSNLQTIFCETVIPPQANGDITSGRYTITLYVPIGTKEAYQTAEEWQKFTNIQETLPVADSITTNSVVIKWQKVDSAVSYTLSVIETESADTVARYEIDSTGNIIKELRSLPHNVPQMVLDTTVSSAEIFEVSLTNLSSGTTYTYAIDAKDSEATIINSSAGTFTTKSETAINTIKEKKTFYHRPINTLGQPIDPKTHQGIYIQNGKKYLNIW